MNARKYLTPSEKAALIDQQDGLCAICGKRLEGPSECDHSTPHAWRPERKPDQVVCLPCHKAKSARDVKAIAKVKRIQHQSGRVNPWDNPEDRERMIEGMRIAWRRRMQSRPFDRRYRKRMDGTVEIRT